MNKLLRRIMIGNRMFLVVVCFAIPIIVLFYLMLIGIQGQINFARYEIYGNAYQRPLEELLRLVPERNRAVLAYLAQPESAASEVGMLDDLIDRAFEDLGRVDSDVGDELQFDEVGLGKRGREHLRYDRFLERWELLRESLADIDATVSARRHEELISAIREAITHSGDTSNLILDPDLDSYYLMDVTLLALPQLQDRLEKITDFATAILSRGVITLEEATKIAVYQAQLQEADYDRTLSSLSTSFKEDPNFYDVSPSLRPSLSGPLSVFEATVTALLASLDSLKVAGRVELAPSEFLTSAGEAADAALALWRTAAEELDTLLEMRISSFQRDRVTAVVLVALAIIVSMAFFFIIARSITTPVRRASEIADSIAQGDLDQEIEIADRGDEIGNLGRSMKIMMENLRASLNGSRDSVDRLSDLVSSIATTSARLSSSAGEIASASQTLSGGAAESAASLEEISSAMADIGSKTRKNEDRVAEADSIAAGALSSATAGAERMELTHSAMVEIAEASEQIGRVVKLIDGIAFQTNLLALNAAVEAARAGTHGKGFSVVAEEVRKLAGRSSEASKETAALIQDAINRIGVGKQHADETRSIIEQVVASISQTASILSAIADASKAQSAAIVDVNRAIEQIEDVTQQNTASAEEAAAAAEELEGQARELRALLQAHRAETSLELVQSA